MQRMKYLLFESGLLQDTVEGAGRNINAQLAGHRHRPWFCRVTKLPTASLPAHLLPAVLLKLMHIHG